MMPKLPTFFQEYFNHVPVFDEGKRICVKMPLFDSQKHLVEYLYAFSQ